MKRMCWASTAAAAYARILEGEANGISYWLRTDSPFVSPPEPALERIARIKASANLAWVESVCYFLAWAVRS